MTSAHQRLNVKHAGQDPAFNLPKDCFANWLAGVTDGDGCFSFSVNKKKNSIWNCTFKVDQSLYNLRLLYVIKKNLGYGRITIDNKRKMATFRIRDRRTLLHLIVPLFTKSLLYSTKQYHFLQWVKALETLENTEYTSAKRDEILTKLKEQVPPSSQKTESVPFLQGLCFLQSKKQPPHSAYVSPSWKKGGPTDEWISGFVEADGSFFLTRKEGTVHRKVESRAEDQPLVKIRVAHAFGITQKLDPIILEFLRKKFHIPTKVSYTKREIYKLETTNSRSVARIRDFFLNKFKGIKSLEYRIWARSLKYKGNSDKLLKAQELLRGVRQQKGRDPSQ